MDIVRHGKHSLLVDEPSFAFLMYSDWKGACKLVRANAIVDLDKEAARIVINILISSFKSSRATRIVVTWCPVPTK